MLSKIELSPLQRNKFAELISYNDEINHGIPSIRGKNVEINIILDDLASGFSFNDIMDIYGIDENDIRACLLEASDMAKKHQWKSHGFHLPKDYFDNPDYFEDPTDEDWERWYEILDEREKSEKM